MKKLILVAVAALSMNVAFANDAVGVGFGAIGDSCGLWLKARRDNELIQGSMVSWAQGYISGLNGGLMLADQKLVILPGPSVVEAWLDKRCAADPTSNALGEMLLLFMKLRQDQGKAPKSK